MFGTNLQFSALSGSCGSSAWNKSKRRPSWHLGKFRM